VDRIVQLLKRLSECEGVSGFEEEIGLVIEEELGRTDVSVEADPLGNRIAYHGGSEGKRSLLLTAHADEVGLIVTDVEPGGLVRFSVIGGIDARVLPGQEVVVHGERRLSGVIGSKPPHLQLEEEREGVVPVEDLFIDIGLSGRTARRQVRVGDPIALSRSFVELEDGLCMSKAFDDRASLAALILALEELARTGHRWDIYAVAAVQEETTHLGAIASAYRINPEIAIVLDATYGDMPGLDEYETYRLGGGPTLGIGPGYHPGLRSRLLEAAEKEKIPCQNEWEPRPRGTDAAPIQLTRDGIATALVSIPVRYMHTPGEVVAIADVERAARLLVRFGVELGDADFLRGSG
jgi:putative aminopeptidase FrvX